MKLFFEHRRFLWWSCLQSPPTEPLPTAMLVATRQWWRTKCRDWIPHKDSKMSHPVSITDTSRGKSKSPSSWKTPNLGSRLCVTDCSKKWPTRRVDAQKIPELGVVLTKKEWSGIMGAMYVSMAACVTRMTTLNSTISENTKPVYQISPEISVQIFLRSLIYNDVKIFLVKRGLACLAPLC